MIFFVIEDANFIYYLESSQKGLIENSISKDDTTVIPLLFLLLAPCVTKYQKV